MRVSLTCVLSALLTLVPVPSTAQTVTATLVGTATDSSGALVPGVGVTVTQLSTNIARKTATSDSGNYSFSQLQPGLYRISAEREGFKHTVVSQFFFMEQWHDHGRY